jgi:hypothetical protein
MVGEKIADIFADMKLVATFAVRFLKKVAALPAHKNNEGD